MQVGDIVRFNGPGICLATEFCWQHNMTGVVARTPHEYAANCYGLRVSGIPYMVYAMVTDLEIVAFHNEIPVADHIE